MHNGTCLHRAIIGQWQGGQSEARTRIIRLLEHSFGHYVLAKPLHLEAFLLKPPHRHRTLTSARHPTRGRIHGGEILRELPSRAASLAFRTVRYMESWSAEDVEARRTEAVPRMAGLDRIAVEIANEPTLEDSFRLPLVTIVFELGSDTPNVPLAELACIAVTDWAIHKQARATALLFAEAAASLANNPRYVYLAGRLHRETGRAKDAELWLRKAGELATRGKDWETRARAEEALGVTHLTAGNYSEAERRFKLGLNVALRRRVWYLVGELWHYLFVVAVSSERYRDADIALWNAARAYGPHHDRLPHFAHDLAVYALDREDNASALQVLVALLQQQHWQEDLPNLLLAHGNTLRALGACRKENDFEVTLRTFARLRDHIPEGATHAQALLAAARGAVRLERWADALSFLEDAIASAGRTRQPDIVTMAEELRVGARERSRAPRQSTVTKRYGDVARITIQALSGR